MHGYTLVKGIGGRDGLEAVKREQGARLVSSRRSPPEEKKAAWACLLQAGNGEAAASRLFCGRDLDCLCPV